MESSLEPRRLTSVSVADFLAFLQAGEPVIICDAMAEWPGSKLWTPGYFREQFGSAYVQVYDDAFELRDIKSLANYLDTYFEKSSHNKSEPTPYVRWYTKLKDVDFVWADAIFNGIKDQWSTPYFMPESGYLLPFALAPLRMSPVNDLFPAKGLFISGAGARTRLHCDPWQTDAVLFQIYGEKSWVMYPPDQGPLLCDGQGQCVDLDNPDSVRFPRYQEAKAAFRFNLSPGEVVLVPQGWYHHVTTTSDAISLTWNFVHRVTQSAFLAYLDSQLVKGDDLEVLRFFFAKWLPKGASCTQMAQFLRGKLELAG